jgi:hypothetical protein
MALDLRGVHVYERVPDGSGHSRLKKTNHYVRITREGHPPIIIQGGKVYGEGGQDIDPLPAWFEEEIAKLTPQVKAECGWIERAADEKARLAVAKTAEAAMRKGA